MIYIKEQSRGAANMVASIKQGKAQMKKKLKKCCRCGEVKEAHLFRDGQKYWCEWCIKCENTPIGQIPKFG